MPLRNRLCNFTIFPDALLKDRIIHPIHRNCITEETIMQPTESKRVPRCGLRNGPAFPAIAGRCAAAMLMLIFMAVPAHSQYRASLQGTVEDTTGAAVPGATITLVDKETNRTASAVSGDTGLFTFNELSPSKYTITITRDGFKKKILDNVAILAEQANSLTAKLEVGAATETVTVNAAEAPVMDTDTGSISGTIDRNDIAKMPSFGRDILQLAQLAPGMFGDGSQASGGGTYSLPGSNLAGSGSTDGIFKTENQAQVFGAGGRMNTNGIALDGVAITSVSWGGAAVITPAEDSIKEMKVSSNPYDAEFGRTSGSQIQMISENGTNSYHGTAFIKLDRPGLNAAPRYDPNGSPLSGRDNARFNQMGGTAGGPILHNKIFGFFSYETIRNSSTSVGTGWYDTPTFDGLASSSGPIATKFLTIPGASAVYNKILEGAGDGRDCASINLVQGVNCNWIQGQGLDLGKPLTIGIGKHDPSFAVENASTGVYTPGLGGDGTGNFATNMDGNADMFYIQTVSPSQIVNQQFNGRLDFQVTPKDLIAATLYDVPTDSTSYNGPIRASNIFYSHTLNYSTGLLYNHTFSNSLLNEARADMAGWRYNQFKSNPQSPLGLPNDFIALNNANSFANVSTAGFGPSIGGIFSQWTLNFKDVATKVYKSHNLKFGGQYTRLGFLDAAPWAASANFYFNNFWDFLNDAPQTESVSGANPLTGVPTMSRKDDRAYVESYFAQDDWKVKPNLTINLGLRWEYFAGMTEKKGNNPVVVLGTGANTFTDMAVVLNRAQTNAPKANFGPQFGFAWSPARDSGKLVIRGGFGVGFDGLEFAITTNTRFNPPFDTNSNLLTGSQIVYGTAGDIHTPFDLPPNSNLITTFNSANLPTNGTVGLTGIPVNLPTAYVFRYSLEGQYDLGRDWVATLGYQASTGRHLPIQYNLYNKYAPAILAGQVAFNPIVNNVDWYEDTGVSNFDAMLAELRHQFAHTFEADVQYRWARTMDTGSQPYAEPDYQFLPGYAWGPSDYDSRNMIKMFGVWSPTIFHGNSMLEKLAGGWTLSPIFNYHSGFPFNPTFGGLGCNAFYVNSGDCSLRPAAYSGQAGRSQKNSAFQSAPHTPGPNFPNGGLSYFTAPAVVNQSVQFTGTTAPTPGPLTGAPGLGRNAFFGPQYSDLDLAITKAFGLPRMKVLGEGARFELRGNAYNLFNKVNLTNIDTNISSNTFGRANSVLGSRTIEVEAHFKF